MGRPADSFSKPSAVLSARRRSCSFWAFSSGHFQTILPVRHGTAFRKLVWRPPCCRRGTSPFSGPSRHPAGFAFRKGAPPSSVPLARTFLGRKRRSPPPLTPCGLRDTCRKAFSLNPRQVNRRFRHPSRLASALAGSPTKSLWAGIRGENRSCPRLPLRFHRSSIISASVSAQTLYLNL